MSVLNDTESVYEFHIAGHVLSWVSGEATNSLSYVHYMGISHAQYHADTQCTFLSNQQLHIIVVTRYAYLW